MRSVYPLTVADFGRHTSPASLDSIPELDTLFVLTTGEPDVLRHAKECAEAFAARGFERSRIKTLVNRQPERNAPSPETIADLLGAPAAGFFTSDYVSLYDAWSEGRLLQGNTKFGKELAALASTVVGRVKGQPEVTPSYKPEPAEVPAGFQKFFSFFRKATA